MRYLWYTLLMINLFCQTAFQPVGLVIISDVLLLNYPENLTFQLKLRSHRVIEKVTLIYSSEVRSCQGRTARKDLEFEPQTSLSLEWDWDFSRSSTLPPGAIVEWQWEITDDSGDTTITEPKSFVVQDQRYGWQQISGNDITVQWYVGDKEFGDELHRVSAQSLEHVEDILGIQFDEHIWITVYPDSEEVQDAVKFTSDWVGGLAFTHHNIIIIAGYPGQDEWLNSVIPHEIAHLLIDTQTFNCKGAWLPTWFDEGLAEYSEGSLDHADRDLIHEASRTSSIPRLRTLSGAFSQDSDRAYLDYIVSNAAVEFLIQEYGSEKMAGFLRHLHSGELFDKALENVYGMKTDELDTAWRQDFGLEVEPSNSKQQKLKITDSPQPTLALYTSAVQVSPTATIIPTHELQQTSRPEIIPEAALSSPTIVSAVQVPEKTDSRIQAALILLGSSIGLMLLAAFLFVYLRRVLR